MRKFLKWSGIVLGGLIGLVVMAVLVLLGVGRARFYRQYAVAVAPLAIPTDEAAIARGEHLVTAVAHCGYCHGPDLAGEYVFNNPGREGVVVVPNLTSGAGGRGATYTAEDWIRTIRHGVTPEGRSVFIMPSFMFHQLSQADLLAIIAYMQTIPPVDNPLPETRPGPLVYALIGAGRLVPAQSAWRIDHDAPFVAAPAQGETAEYGAYLAQIGQCTLCHGPDLAGGRACRDCMIGPNLTPGGALGGWTKQDFITALRSGVEPAGRQIDPFMPWQFFSKMTDTELGALWAYLQAQPALESQQP